VYTYTAGTTTPKNSFTSATGLTPNANPVVLDSAGRAEIWLTGSYRIDVKTSADVLVRSVDNFTAFSSGGNMSSDTYDPANIAQQLVGTTAVQTLTNKTLTSPSIGGTVTDTALYSTRNVSPTAGLSKTSDTTLADVPGMTLNLEVGAYIIEFGAPIVCASAGGVKLAYLFSGTATGISTNSWGMVNGGTALSGVVIGGSSLSPVTNFTGSVDPYIKHEIIFGVSVAGNFKLQLAQSVSNASPTEISGFAYMKAVKIA
jgi:hypothetical protein